jgi:hypothetical protein
LLGLDSASAALQSLALRPQDAVATIGSVEDEEKYPPAVASSEVGLQLRVRFVPAALLAMLRTALALHCVSKARDWTSHVDR